MNISELLSVLWHQKVTVLATMAVFILGAVGVLEVVTPQYQAKSTLALSTRSKNLNNLIFFQTIDSIMTVYATAAQTDATKSIAKRNLHGKLADISVRTFSGSPILEIVAKDSSPALARASAQQETDALEDRVAAGGVGFPSLHLQQIDRPTYPTTPVFPRRKLTIAVAALLGLAFGIGAALLRESLANKVRTHEELAEATGVSVLAEIPFESGLAQRVSPALLGAYPGVHGVIEAFRDLRTNLLFPTGKVSSVVITSPEGRQGKTTVSLGLAVTMARAGAHILLLDADLRRGTLSELLDLERRPGLREVLEGARPDAVIRTTALPGLDIMTGGGLLADPGELLAARFPELLKQLERAYDTVIVDTTPLVPVGDARIVSGAAAATVIVVGSGAASRTAVRQAVERLAQIAVTPSGSVLNKSRARHARGYYEGPQSTEDGSPDLTEKVHEQV
jgi:receptor protein-tyrosine kinase